MAALLRRPSVLRSFLRISPASSADRVRMSVEMSAAYRIIESGLRADAPEGALKLLEHDVLLALQDDLQGPTLCGNCPETSSEHDTASLTTPLNFDPRIGLEAQHPQISHVKTSHAAFKRTLFRKICGSLPNPI